MAYMVVPVELPDGRTVVEERGKAKDVIDALKAYDPCFQLVRRWTPPAWQVARRWDDGHTSWELNVPGDYLPDPGWWIQVLSKGDLWLPGNDPIGRIDAMNDARQRDEDRKVEAIAEASADRIHYELVDEFRAHAPASRPMFLNPAVGARRRRVSR